MEEKIYQQAYEAIKNAKQVLLVTHDRPDGDAISSTCALIELLVGMGKPFFAFCQDPPPYQFAFLAHSEKINSNRNEFNFSDFDLIIALDCGGLNKTHLVEEIRSRKNSQKVVVFDHHPKIDDYAEIEIKEPGLSSTAEVVYYFFKHNGLPINKLVANCILTGILTDTANFLHDSTRSSTINIASEMLLLGARFPQILENTWRNKSLAAMKLWGEALGNLQINKPLRLAFSVIPHNTLKDSGATEEELEGLAGFLGNLSGVNGLLLLREETPGRIKGSLRAAHPRVDISLLAQLLGGGGHPKASGFVLNLNLEASNGKWRVL